ncbi:TPA: hypothetical protein EYP66_25030 [Candidatus Poribacteria bacterium]|nr:hypothetical protein [Candidatus Poribacteria bacterium]
MIDILHELSKNLYSNARSADEYFDKRYALSKIHTPEAWKITPGSEDIIIAIVDSGVDYDHPDLTDKIWTNKGEIPNNGKDDDGNHYIDDYYGFNFVGATGAFGEMQKERLLRIHQNSKLRRMNYVTLHLSNY